MEAKRAIDTGGFWSILVVDDDNDVHRVTKFALSDYEYGGKHLEIRDAYGFDEAISVLKEEAFAVILLDVVMEENDSGLKLVKHIRDELKDHLVRIILRTGQPGAAPQDEVIMGYDINDYLSKTELTDKRLFSSLTTAIRSYVELKGLQASNTTLEELIEKRTKELKELNATLELRVQEALEKFALMQKENDQKDALLLEQSKMAALGEMVGSFSHEMNTPLGISVTAASAMGDSTREIKALYEGGKIKKSDFLAFIEKSEELSKIILSNVSRAAELMTGLKHIAVDQSSGQKRVVNLKQYLEEIVLSLKPKFKKTNIKVDIACSNNIEINIHAGLFSQVVINLIINSLVHGFDIKHEGTIQMSAVLKNGVLEYIHSDDGDGMSDEAKSRLFEQYFTTKKNAGGSGIGMHLIKTIVTEKLSGAIEFQSEVGRGTTFNIRFPVS